MKELVKRLQEDLNKLGYDCSTPDGIIGPKTVASITKFQKDHKMEADGMAGPITRNAIAKAIEDKNKPTVRTMVKGSKGDDVKKLQEKLNKLGFMCDTPDGNFGPKTLQAVNDFQDATFGNHDSEVGPKTMAKIDSWIAKIYKAKVNSSNGLNIRKSFNLSSSKIGSLANGKDIQISVIKNDFGKLAGRDGWVMLKWTKKV
jgi:peptidoglycan hydrolase-like protein with peptidoglycan-binding domain